jgi:hypothetical protein
MKPPDRDYCIRVVGALVLSLRESGATSGDIFDALIAAQSVEAGWLRDYGDGNPQLEMEMR